MGSLVISQICFIWKLCHHYELERLVHFSLTTYKEKQNPDRFYNKVDNQLKLNRKLLKEYNKGGKVTIRTKVLLELGFDPNFFTHYWKNQKGEVYFFVYEYGFLKKNENRKDKYVLVTWQDYMRK